MGSNLTFSYTALGIALVIVNICTAGLKLAFPTAATGAALCCEMVGLPKPVFLAQLRFGFLVFCYAHINLASTFVTCYCGLEECIMWDLLCPSSLLPPLFSCLLSYCRPLSVPS